MAQNSNSELDKEKTMHPEMDISYDDLLMVSSGVTKDGHPASMATVVIDKINYMGEQAADMQVLLQNAVLYLFHSGGSTVMQADFPRTAAFEFSQAIEILSVFSQNSSDDEYVKNHGFGTVVVPMALYGKISIVFQDVVYFTGFDLPNMEKRLIICFNDLATEVIQAGENIDYAEIEQTVRADLQRQHDKLEEEIQEVQAALEKEQNNNPYQQMIEERYGREDNTDSVGENGQTGSSWIRISKD